jgi:formate hydrogenlyase subunit 3/multisubunit Na+/H+ antiporter MnhD subunit
MKSIFYAVIAIAAGVIVLLGSFIDLPILTNLHDHLLLWGMIIAAVATWVGVANLISVHAQRIKEGKTGQIYSIILLAAFGLTLIGGIIESLLSPGKAPLQDVIDSIQVPVEASLMAVLTVSLVYAAVRLLRRRRDAMAVVFLGSALVFLALGSGILPLANVPFLQDLADSINRLPLAGVRGILLGVALGSLATGLRILLGADRPYRS